MKHNAPTPVTNHFLQALASVIQDIPRRRLHKIESLEIKLHEARTLLKLIAEDSEKTPTIEEIKTFLNETEAKQ